MELSRTQSFFILLLSTLILGFYGFYNRYPMLYSDTGAYIYTGFENVTINSRPIIYGLFLRHISLKLTLWLPMLFQCFLIVYLLNIYFKKFITIKNSELFTLVTSILLSAFSGLSVLTSTLMPDIFTSIGILAFGLIFFCDSLSTMEKVFLILISLISTMVHLSHLNVYLLIFLSITLLYFLFRNKWNILKTINIKKIYIGFAIVVGGFISLGTINKLYDGEFYINKTSHVFFMAKMCESGILEKYLKEQCVNNGYSLCNYKDSIPRSTASMLWDYANSPLYKTGGWDNSKEEYTKIILETFKTPKYLKLHVAEAFKATLAQLFVFDVGDGISSYQEGSAPNNNIKSHMPIELNQQMCALQSYGQFDFHNLNNRQIIAVCFTIIILALYFMKIGMFVNYTMNDKLLIFGLFLIITLVANAFICGFFANVYTRLQARVIWLVPFFFLLVLADYIKQRENKIA